jgi:hypothetical protein
MASTLMVMGFSLLAVLEAPPLVGDLAGSRRIVETWNLSAAAARHWQITSPPDSRLPDEDFQRVDTSPLETDLLAGLKWKQKARKDRLLELDLDDGWTGGRILCWRVADGLMVERLSFGSGVAVTGAQRFKLRP